MVWELYQHYTLFWMKLHPLFEKVNYFRREAKSVDFVLAFLLQYGKIITLVCYAHLKLNINFARNAEMKGRSKKCPKH